MACRVPEISLPFRAPVYFSGKKPFALPLPNRYKRLRILVQVNRAMRRKVVVSAVLLVVVLLFQFAMPGNYKLVHFYDYYIFKPWQTARNQVLGLLRFSVGDWLYLIALISLVVALGRALYFGIRFATHRWFLGNNLLNTFITVTIIYLLFFIGWGGNYYKPRLQKVWDLEKIETPVITQLKEFDGFLVSQLNALAPHYREMRFEEVDKAAVAEYQCCTDSRTSLKGLNAKPSLFGHLMQYFGIQGYYNPWTGEAQVNQHLPSFMLPFVTCHEMAHQSGIASEEDANLLSYAICTRSGNPAFRYSGYFNLWLYTHGMLREEDSVAAKGFLDALNPVSRAHRDTLRAIREQYRGETSAWSMALYDSYLRLHDQKEGVKSYNRVALSAWAFEKKRKVFEGKELHVP